jgi:hypothetical protein
MTFDQAVSAVVSHVQRSGRKKAVAFIKKGDRYTTVTATYHGPRLKRERQHSIVLTIGQPNYTARRYLSLCRKAGMKPRSLWFPGGSNGK